MSQDAKATAIIVAGGAGQRAGGGLPKQFRPLLGQPVLRWSAEAFLRDARFSTLIVVCPPQWRTEAARALEGLDWRPAEAGSRRVDSVRAGLAAAPGGAQGPVFIHDAARPGLTPDVLDRLFAALADGADGTAPALPVGDALWREDHAGALGAHPRDGLMRVQTPQAFDLQRLRAAWASLPPDADPLDDLEVLAGDGGRLRLVAGSHMLDKLTWPGDFDRMGRLLAAGDARPSLTGARSDRLAVRTATGFDAHRLGPGDHVTLCGVRIAFERGLVGHSDADVGWHALCDAIYGAMAEGDIGRHFPPSDPRWKGAPSSVFLSHAGARVRAVGGRIVHVDVTLICEGPRISPHSDAMRRATASALGLDPSRVSVKATTTEGMGFAGRGEGIAALASATLALPDMEHGMEPWGAA